MEVNEYLNQFVKEAEEHNKSVDHDGFFADIQPIIKEFTDLVRLYGYKGSVSICVDADAGFNVTAHGFYAFQRTPETDLIKSEVA